jgi:predicted RNA-binding Zn ribbon-like protein
MTSHPARTYVDPSRSFKYIAGDPSLDFINTVDWTDAGLEDERLLSYDALTRWGEGAGILAADEGSALRRVARRDPPAAAAALEEAYALRWVLKQAFSGAGVGASSESALQRLNTAIAPALGRLRIEPRAPGSDELAWGWRGWGETLDCVLWPVAWAAGRLLTSEERDRIHVCAGPRCGWVFVDRSRNGLRRWCQTGVCGAQAKARRYYARRRGARSN